MLPTNNFEYVNILNIIRDIKKNSLYEFHTEPLMTSNIPQLSDLIY